MRSKFLHCRPSILSQLTQRQAISLIQAIGRGEASCRLKRPQDREPKRHKPTCGDLCLSEDYSGCQFPDSGLGTVVERRGRLSRNTAVVRLVR